MPRVSGFQHRSGRHCRTAALRNISDFYEWEFDEPACFGFGAGLATIYAERPGMPRRGFNGVAPWLEGAFFERLDVPHRDREGDDWASAWDDVTEHLDSDDPVLLLLDPDSLEYLGTDHTPPHAAVAVGYDDEAVELSDGARDDVQDVAREDLRDAWTIDRFAPMEHRRIVVTRGRVLQDRRTAATRAVAETAAYMRRPLDAERTTGGPGEEGLPALESLAADIPGLGDDGNASPGVAAILGGIDCHGVDAAYRDLYADAIEGLESWASAGGDKGERMRDIANGWRRVGELLADVVGSGDGQAVGAALAEAGGVLGDVAEREAAFFEDVEDAVR